MSYGIKAYKAVGVKDDLAIADPHRVIQLLMQGSLENMAKAKGAIERKDYATKAQAFGKAIAIVSALKGSLDMKEGGEISQNLDSLYEFMINHLTLASREQSIAKVNDVMELMLTIKSAWDQISVSDREQGYKMREQLNPVPQQLAVGA
ncbi:flagellar export chaperone FliS [Alishewanella tabrizica]|uniref:Flagellar secretion chaperone FliS n=1 Tax=Alishewanella tabrizica TaxID=671278 RepID=A0ABQ2WM42_9ALTE|nr:flagellar export chaperone FliS [Alishewanella tabrizica]GGW63471.1 flagellar protein FliS [Alishewanella tabrizica]